MPQHPARSVSFCAPNGPIDPVVVSFHASEPESVPEPVVPPNLYLTETDFAEMEVQTRARIRAQERDRAWRQMADLMFMPHVYMTPGSYTGRVTRVHVDGDRFRTEIEAVRRNDQPVPLTESLFEQAFQVMERIQNEDGVVTPAYQTPIPLIDRIGQTVVTPRRRVNRGPRQYRPAPGCKAFPS